jgi:hypothetical protein
MSDEKDSGKTSPVNKKDSNKQSYLNRNNKGSKKKGRR